jgi:hypothetical protein
LDLRWNEVKGKWKQLHIMELDDMYCSQNIIGVIKREERDGWDM